MIQDIFPKTLDIDYIERPAKDEDQILIIEDGQILIKYDQVDLIHYPKVKDLNRLGLADETQLMYLFSVEGVFFYLYTGQRKVNGKHEFEFMEKRGLYNTKDNYKGFVGMTANHIHEWFIHNKYCGKCGGLMKQKSAERMLVCSECGNGVYPRINPVVIVGIKHKDKLLLTKYADSNYDRYALVAGFVEIGESFEDTVKREVFEEVGLKVKNIRYFASQPWGITGGLLAGYFADLDGEDEVKLDLDELKEASWMTKDQMPEVYPDEKSLTRTMMYHWYKNQSKA